MSDLIITPGESAPVKGVETDLDSIGRGTGTSIDGHTVRITYSRDEVGAGGDFPLSNYDKK